MQDKEKQNILTFNNLEPSNILYFFWNNYLNQTAIKIVHGKICVSQPTDQLIVEVLMECSSTFLFQSCSFLLMLCMLQLGKFSTSKMQEKQIGPVRFSMLQVPCQFIFVRLPN